MSTNELDRVLEGARISAEAFDAMFGLPTSGPMAVKLPEDMAWNAEVARAVTNPPAIVQWLREHYALRAPETTAGAIQWERLLGALK